MTIMGDQISLILRQQVGQFTLLLAKYKMLLSYPHL